MSTKKRILQDAKDAAREIYLDYRFRQKNGLPVISKRFADVAALCRATMKQQLENGVGKKSFRDYIIVIDKYLVPFFGDLFVTSIDYEMMPDDFETMMELFDDLEFNSLAQEREAGHFVDIDLN